MTAFLFPQSLSLGRSDNLVCGVSLIPTVLCFQVN